MTSTATNNELPYNLAALAGKDISGFKYEVQRDVFDVCRILLRHENLNPCVAGGALWAWAANEVPRDIDIFLGRGFWRSLTLRRLEQRYGAPIHGRTETHQATELQTEARVVAAHDDYGFTKDVLQNVTREVPVALEGVPTEAWDGRVDRFHTVTGHGTSVDLVLTGARYGAERVSNFDYKHVRVGWGARNPAGVTRIYEGAWFYMRGLLLPTPNRSRVRTEEVIKKKLQPKLWGKCEAGAQLEAVFSLLLRSYLLAAAHDLGSSNEMVQL